jgi:hypothetical protein
MYTMVNSKLIKRLFTGVVAPFVLLVCASIPAAASPKVTVLAFGLFGSQSVFESEAKGAADIVAHQLVEDSLQSAVNRMDPENDVLFLILTSHGSRAGIAVQAGRHEETLSPAALAGMLGRTGVQHRVVIVSACYSVVIRLPGQGQVDLLR